MSYDCGDLGLGSWDVTHACSCAERGDNNVSASSLMSDSEVIINVKGFVIFYLNKIIRIILTSF